MKREKIRCAWCGKHNRTASDWEQQSTRPARPDDDPGEVINSMLGSRIRCWKRLCVRCANRRLDNPYSALLNMRRIGRAA